MRDAASTPGGSASRSGGKGERDRLPAQPSSAANKHGWTTIVVIAYILAWVAGFFTVAALYGTHGWLFPVVAFAPIVGPVFLAEAAGVA